MLGCVRPPTICSPGWYHQPGLNISLPPPYFISHASLSISSSIFHVASALSISLALSIFLSFFLALSISLSFSLVLSTEAAATVARWRKRRWPRPDGGSSGGSGPTVAAAVASPSPPPDLTGRDAARWKAGGGRARDGGLALPSARSG